MCNQRVSDDLGCCNRHTGRRKLGPTPKLLTAKPGRQVVINIAVTIIPLINNNRLLSIYYGLGTGKCFHGFYFNSHNNRRKQMLSPSGR